MTTAKELYELASSALGSAYDLTLDDKATLLKLAADGWKVRTVSHSAWSRSLTGKLVRVTTAVSYPGVSMVPDQGELYKTLMQDLNAVQATAIENNQQPLEAVSAYFTKDKDSRFICFSCGVQ